MIFTSKTVCKNINIIFDKQLIERIHTTKFYYVSKKINKSLSIIYKVKNIVQVNSLKYLYNALILPHLYYCCGVWGNTSSYLIERVVVLQKRAIKVISKSGYMDPHSSPIHIIYAFKVHGYSSV